MAVLASDSGSGADANPIGGNWTTIAAETALTRASSTIQPTDVTNDGGAYNNSVTWPNDQYAQMAISVTGSGGGGQGYGVGVRIASGGARTYYRVVADHAGSNNVELSKQVTGSFSLIWSRTQAFTDGDTLRLEAQGTTLRVKFNGTQIGADQIDPSIVAGNAGINFSSSETAASGVNWEGGDFSGGGPTVAQELPAFVQGQHEPWGSQSV